MTNTKTRSILSHQSPGKSWGKAKKVFNIVLGRLLKTTLQPATSTHFRQKNEKIPPHQKKAVGVFKQKKKNSKKKLQCKM